MAAPAAEHVVTGLLPDDELAAVRAQFPLLSRRVGDAQLTYLDSGATSQKPLTVLEADRDWYTRLNAGVHRGAHTIATEASQAYESARAEVASFVGAPAHELVWTSGATAALNLVAHGVALRPGDEVVVSRLEHHANLVPWQQACLRTGATLRWLEVTDEGRLDLGGLGTVVGVRTRVVALTHASNVTGAVTDVGVVVARAREVGALVLLDACQSVPHLPVDVASLGADLVAFSAHKALGPTGIGALWGRAEVLAQLPPMLTGGSMVDRVTMEATTFAPPPQRFEAGTQANAQTAGFAAAVRWLGRLGMDRVAAHEHALTERLLAGVAQVPGVRVLGPLTAQARIGAVSVVVDGVHAHDVSQVLDAAGIAVRAGHHCAAPLHSRFGVTASTRASVHVYTTPAEVDRFCEVLGDVRPFFGLRS